MSTVFKKKMYSCTVMACAIPDVQPTNLSQDKYSLFETQLGITFLTDLPQTLKYLICL